MEILILGASRRAAASRLGTLGLGVLAAVVLGAVVAPGAWALTPEQDPFYKYEGKKTTLAAMAPGTVIKTRTVKVHVEGIELPITAVQLLYRSTSELRRPTVNVTSVLLPPVKLGTVVSYQSFYDSLSPEDDPSYAISGGTGTGGEIPQAETPLVSPLLLAGQTVVISDTEGEEADFAAGPVYGYNTLDSLRAALSSPATGLSTGTKVAMIGYSGGAIATEWAAQEAPTYAPDINADLVGASFGGVLVEPAHNLTYIEGSSSWASVIPMSLDGLARAFHLNLAPYESEYGKELLAADERASITNRKEVPGLTWAQLAKPEYANPDSVGPYVTTANKLIMGHEGHPTVPLLIGQGNGGEEFEGTQGNKPGIGPGDGVMIAGDVRSLARQYCGDGLAVHFTEYQHLGHVEGAAPWLTETLPWLAERFAGLPAPQDCSEIAPGNPLTPVKKVKAG